MRRYSFPPAPRSSHSFEGVRKVWLSGSASKGPEAPPSAPLARHAKVGAIGMSSINAAVDSTKDSLRFVARTLFIHRAGLTAECKRGRVEISWKDIASVVARRLPPDPPFEKTLFMDIAPAGGSPIRLLSSTRANYEVLPGGAGLGSAQNFQKLAALIKQASPNAIEADSRPFFESGEKAPMFAAIKLFAAYDSQYG